ncbi:MAG: polysaccharide export protein [Sphingomonadales bacterium]|nr:MAG: polysaccharide export protein [Sphingomonadales bacterium]
MTRCVAGRWIAHRNQYTSRHGCLGHQYVGGRTEKGETVIPRPLLASMLALSLGCLAACTETGGLPLEAASTLPQSDAVYRVGTGDVLRVSTYMETDLTNEFTVLPNGKLAFPLTGEVDVAGMTTEEIRLMLEQRLGGGMVKNPKVAVNIAEFRPIYILGEVSKPGRYPFEANMTLQRAVAVAGGYTVRANSRQLILHRDGDTVNRRVPLEVKTQFTLRPGDTLTVPKRYF